MVLQKMRGSLRTKHMGGVVAWKSVSHHHHHHHHHSAWQRTERRCVYGDTGMMEMGLVMGLCRDTGVTKMDWATGSIYLGDPVVDRSHHILSSYNQYTLYLSQHLGLTCSVWDGMDPCNCVDPHKQVVPNLLTLFLPSSGQNCSVSWIPFGCRERCGGVFMMYSLPFNSFILPQRPWPVVITSQIYSVFLICCMTGEISCWLLNSVKLGHIVEWWLLPNWLHGRLASAVRESLPFLSWRCPHSPWTSCGYDLYHQIQYLFQHLSISLYLLQLGIWDDIGEWKPGHFRSSSPPRYRPNLSSAATSDGDLVSL